MVQVSDCAHSCRYLSVLTPFHPSSGPSMLARIRSLRESWVWRVKSLDVWRVKSVWQAAHVGRYCTTSCAQDKDET